MLRAAVERPRVSAVCEIADGTWTPAADCPPNSDGGWRAFADAYLSLFWGIARGKYGLPWDEAEEVVSRTWLVVYEKRASMPGGAARSRWLASVLCWKCRDVIRERSDDGQLPPDLPAPGEAPPDDVVALLEMRDIVLQLVADLPERDRTLIEGRYLVAPPRTYAELAALLGVAENSVGPLLSRALKLLGRRLRDRGVD